MRILHTSDWHLGKKLEGHSRLAEQELFLQELVQIAEEEKIDLILLAGDIYDVYNPPAAAEELLYRFLPQLTNEGSRPLLMIAGNHDNPERLNAISPLVGRFGVMIAGLPGTEIPLGTYGEAHVSDSGPGYVCFSLRGEQVTCALLPYPSEKRMNEVWEKHAQELAEQQSYSERIDSFLQVSAEHFRENTINLVMAHIYVAGGLESDSERSIDLGGALAVNPKALPGAQYIALGHLHRPQKVGGVAHARYAGSPLQYSRSEINYSKSVYIIEVKAGAEASVDRRLLHNYRPLEVWICNSIEAALQKAQEEPERNGWLYIDINTSRALTGAEIKILKEHQPAIVQIRTELNIGEASPAEKIDEPLELAVDELFRSFYRHERGDEVPEELMKLFYELSRAPEPEEGNDETALS